jgi:glycosyltransferase involved in cell wall biosynthesis
MEAEVGTRPRILIVSPWPTLWSMAPGAGVSDESHMFAGLVRAGWDIDLLVPRAGPVADVHPGVAVHRFANVLAVPGWLPAPLQRVWLLPAFWSVAAHAAVRLARRTRPALVIGFSHYGAWPAWRAGRAAGVPCMLKLFGVMHAMRLDWPLPRYLYHSLEGVLAFKVPLDHFLILNDGTRGDVVARRWGVAPERITYLPNGIDTQWAERPFDRAATRAAHGAPPDGVVFLALSRLVLSKRVDRIVAALAAAAKRIPAPVSLWVAGDGPLRATLEAQCSAAGVTARFLGTIPHAQVPEILAAADVLVSTSTLTNMSIPTCEAMVVGTPVVALDVGGTSEVVRDGETGLLVPEADGAALVAALARIAGDAPLRRRLGAGAREFAARHFMSWEARVAAEVALVERLTARGRSATPTTAARHADGAP